MIRLKQSRTDTNHADIRATLRQMGFIVDDVYFIPKLYDMVVTGQAAWSGGRSVAVRVEVKMKGRKLTADEQEYWDSNETDNLIIAYTADDVLRWFGVDNG